jgi:hypothetical protein
MSLAAHPERWWPLVDYRADTRWCRLLERATGHEVWLQSWLPGQGSELHDHGPASGAFAVAVGMLSERAVTHRNTGEVTRHLAAGWVRAFGPHYLHQLTNTGAVPAVSVHVYGVVPPAAVQGDVQGPCAAPPRVVTSDGMATWEGSCGPGGASRASERQVSVVLARE